MSARDAARRISEALAEHDQPEPVCPQCGGDGWYVGHEDACYDKGDCCCSGAQIQCECQDTPS